MKTKNTLIVILLSALVGCITFNIGYNQGKRDANTFTGLQNDTRRINNAITRDITKTDNVLHRTEKKVKNWLNND